MNASTHDLPPSGRLGIKLARGILRSLNANGGHSSRQDVLRDLERTGKFTEWESEMNEKRGLPRWRVTSRFVTTRCVKAGLMVTKKGLWYLTEDGSQALDISDADLWRVLNDAMRQFKADKRAQLAVAEEMEESEEVTEEEAGLIIDEIEQKAVESFKLHIANMNPYEFQDLVAALLRGMGYYTPFVAPRGKDGGIDVVAYRDPLGTQVPRIKVQVKHRQQGATVQELRQLTGVLHNGEVGIFVSSGGFTIDARATGASSAVHIELIDLDRFIELWQEFYPKMTESDRRIMPLKPIYVLADDI